MPSEEIDGVVISSFPNASTIENNDVVTGLHNGNNANFLFSGITAYIRQGLSNIFVTLSRIGTPNGVASLDNTGKVPSTQLPPIPSDASDITYDPTTSGLSATDVQDAIDEVQDEIDNLPSPPDPSDTNPQDLGTAAAGSSADYSRADHVHNKPTYTKADIGLGSVDNVQQYSASNPPPYPVTSVNGNTGAVTVPVPSAYTSNPAMDGTASPGSSGAWAKGDHVHPSDTSRVPVIGKGKNLLRNWYFVGGGTGRGVFPVNQRGQSSYTAIGYTVDGWWNRGPLSVTVGSDSITISNTSGHTNWVQQFLPDLPEETFTISILVTAVTGTVNLVMQTTTSPFQTPAVTENLSPGCIWASGSSVSGRKYRVGLYVENNSSVTFKAIKLELGTEQTIAHQENGVWVLNEIPDYEYELYRCITSTADSTDTYANKSLATRQDLTNIQATGTTNTTGAAIPAGAFFYLNGVLHRAKTQIDVNATFTPGTNCEPATEGGLNKLQNIVHPSSLTLTYSLIGIPLVRASSNQRKFVLSVPYGYSTVNVTMQSSNILTRVFGASTSTTFSVTSLSASLSGYCLSVTLNGTGLESAMDVLALDNGLVITLS